MSSWISWIRWPPDCRRPSYWITAPLADFWYCFEVSADVVTNENRASVSVLCVVKLPVARRSANDLIFWMCGSSDVSARYEIVSCLVQYSLPSVSSCVPYRHVQSERTREHPCARQRQCCSAASCQRGPAFPSQTRATESAAGVSVGKVQAAYNDDVESGVQDTGHLALADNRAVTQSKVVDHHAQVQVDRLLLGKSRALCNG